jgi:hypothetical protein
MLPSVFLGKRLILLLMVCTLAGLERTGRDNWLDVGLAFTHIRTATDCAGMLRIIYVYASAEFEETGWIPFGRVGYYFVEEGFEALSLGT